MAWRGKENGGRETHWEASMVTENIRKVKLTWAGEVVAGIGRKEPGRNCR